MTDTLKSMRNRGDFRGRKRICSHSLNLKKYKKCINCRYYHNYIGLKSCNYLKQNKKSEYINPTFIHTSSEPFQFNKCKHFTNK